MKPNQLSDVGRGANPPATSVDQPLTSEQQRFADVLGGLLADRWAQTNSAVAGMATIRDQPPPSLQLSGSSSPSGFLTTD
jgi:hypothetical protein